MSSSSLPEAGAKLTLDLSEWESNWSSAMDNADQLTAALDDISGSVDVEVNLDIPDTSEFDDIQALDGETISPEIDATESEDSKKIREGISFLATMKAIEVAINVIGTAVDFVKDLGNLVVSPFLDIEDSVARINAQTGGGTGIDDLGQFIRDIQAADLGESVDQITDVVIAAKQLGAPIEEATTAALTFTHTFDQNPVNVLTTLNTLVETGLVPNLQAAADLMTVAFQQGVNKGNDVLSVVNANAQSWADMGINGTQAMSAINSLLDNGVDSATDAAKMFQTVDDALTIAAANADSPQAQMLKTMGLENPKDSGQAMGADFIDGFATAFTALSSDQQDLASGLLFGKAGKKFTGALENMTTQGGPFGDIVGAASDAATEIDNSLRGAIDDFVLEINTKLAELLSSDSIDLPGKIEDLKKGFQKAVDVLANGGTVGDALEIGLNIPGFADGIDRFEASVGNFAISVLEIVAGIQEFLGKDSSGTRGQITALEKNQLPFNLQIANPDEIAGELQTAIDRGLTTSDIAKATGTAFNEMIAGGDIDKAQALVDGLNKIASTGGPMLASGLNGLQISLAEAALRDGDLARIQEQIDAGNLIAPVSVDTTVMQQSIADAVEAAKPPVQTDGWWQNLKPPSDFLETALSSKDVGGKTSGNGWWTNFQPTAEKTGDATTAFDDLQTHAETSMSAVSTAVTTANDESVASLEGLSLQAQLTDTDIATAMTGNTVTASFEAVALAAQTSFPAVIEWFNRTSQASAVLDTQVSGHIGHLLGLLHDLQFLSAQVATGVQAALTLGAGMGGGNTTNNNNVVVNNNVNNTAAAAANGYAVAASIRNGGV